MDKNTLKIPTNVKQPGCEGECPLYDFGDGGYGEHCNLLEHKAFMSPENLILYKRYRKLQLEKYNLLAKRYEKVHELKGKLPYNKWLIRHKRIKRLDMRLKIKMQKAHIYYHKCPFYEGK